MNTKEAISFLKKQGFSIYDDGTPADDDGWRSHDEQRRKELKNKTLYRIWMDGSSYGVFTGRELVKFANGQKGTIDKDFKKFNNSTVRRATRDLIKNEKFDDIPPNAPPEREDRWSWD